MEDPGNLRCWDKISATQAVYIFDGRPVPRDLSIPVFNPRAHFMCSSRQFSRKGFQPDIELYLRKMPFMKGAQVKRFALLISFRVSFEAKGQ